MPPELAAVELDGAAPPEAAVEDVVEGVEDCVDELEDCVAGLDCAAEDELEEFEPQAASPKAATSRTPAASRRVNLVVEVVMNRSLVFFLNSSCSSADAAEGMVIPGTVAPAWRRPSAGLATADRRAGAGMARATAAREENTVSGVIGGSKSHSSGAFNLVGVARFGGKADN
jgi:hypothetical protein